VEGSVRQWRSALRLFAAAAAVWIHAYGSPAVAVFVLIDIDLLTSGINETQMKLPSLPALACQLN
jgi:hypothetical protein